MDKHETCLRVVNGVSKYGRPKRMYQAVCSCGWEAWANVAKWVAEERLVKHQAEVAE